MVVQELFDVYLRQDTGYVGAGRCFHGDEELEHCDLEHQDYYTDEIHWSKWGKIMSVEELFKKYTEQYTSGTILQEEFHGDHWDTHYDSPHQDFAY